MTINKMKKEEKKGKERKSIYRSAVFCPGILTTYRRIAKKGKKREKEKKEKREKKRGKRKREKERKGKEKKRKKERGKELVAWEFIVPVY